MGTAAKRCIRVWEESRGGADREALGRRGLSKTLPLKEFTMSTGTTILVIIITHKSCTYTHTHFILCILLVGT